MGRSSRRKRYEYDCAHAALPPLEAWKSPEQWCADESGRLKQIPADEKIALPTDDRSFILPEESIETVLDLFEDDYEWPVSACCQYARVDNHHWYHPRLQYTSDYIAAEFRALAYNRALLPRQFHNVLHAITHAPTIPDRDDMEAYSESHAVALHVLSRLGNAATTVVELQSKWREYREQGERCEAEYDMLSQQFNTHFTRYGTYLERARDMNTGHVLHGKERPAQMAKRLEGVRRAMGACGVDYLGMFPNVA